MRPKLCCQAWARDQAYYWGGYWVKRFEIVGELVMGETRSQLALSIISETSQTGAGRLALTK